MNPWKLNYWVTGEYQAAREKLDDEVAKGYKINPDRRSLFRALSLVAEKDVRCCIVGQDPYPQHRFATGVAFSIPSDIPRREWPPTLTTFLQEWSDDLGYNMPDNGNLEEWCKEGVLLWNAIPSCREGASLSHDWKGREWDNLTSEIITRLSSKGIVFALCGVVAKRFRDLVNEPSITIITSHPSPRGSLNSRTPFLGSRLFSTINARLKQLGMTPVDWSLHGASTKTLPRTNLVGGRILENITGVDLPRPDKSNRPNTYIGNFNL
jgi:uracil-DNA glycosylase